MDYHTPQRKGQTMSKVYDIVTERIINLLEAGTVPWKKPWSSELPKNLASGKEYRGINLFLLNCMPYDSPWWLTYKQAEGRGGHVRKGEKSSLVVFWKLREIEEKDPVTGELVKGQIPVLRYYNVFNVRQCEGVPAPEIEGAIKHFSPISDCSRILRGMPNRPKIQHKESYACYRRSCDVVNMPRPNTFHSREGYYSVLFHELAHSTGHQSRLDRHDGEPTAPFGSKEYSKEELVAEMTASFLCGSTGIVDLVVENSAAYIQGWLKKLRNDRKLIVHAAAAAQKAADYVRGESKNALV